MLIVLTVCVPTLLGIHSARISSSTAICSLCPGSWRVFFRTGRESSRRRRGRCLQRGTIYRPPKVIQRLCQNPYIGSDNRYTAKFRQETNRVVGDSLVVILVEVDGADPNLLVGQVLVVGPDTKRSPKFRPSQVTRPHL